MSFWRRYPHFVAFVAVMLTATAALWPTMGPAVALLAGFDAGTMLFLGLLARRFRNSEPDTMRHRAAANEPDHMTLSAVGSVIVLVVLTAVGIELFGGERHNGAAVSLAAITLLLAWAFANSLFTLHYAHVYYLGGKNGDLGGLEFPGGDKTPDYWDFAYFAFVLGMTFQVSDVAATSKRMRRLALAHALVAFVFNIAVVALSVNLVAAVLGG